MSFDNLGNTHFNEEQKTVIFEALQLAIVNLEGMSANLSPKERSKYGKVVPDAGTIDR
ncbi:hypothetical protein [Flavobacterium sp. 3HN19-14]|uniref:hypothetical protein n=1 Tax=Flavobacterium sp. 3HN19-14 TaxID=3448133 RepID=UPI003EDEA92A